MRRRRPAAPLALVLALVPLAAGCSLRRFVLGGLGSSLADSARTFAREDDPELVRESLPFALKAMEAVLLESSADRALLLGASAGFGLYAAGFLAPEAAELERRDWAGAERLRARARALALRGRDYARTALELGHPGLGERLVATPGSAAAELEREDVEAAYLAGGLWGLAISLGKDDPALVADLEVVRALLGRALELDEGFREGLLHEAWIAIEGLAPAMGGSSARARAHFARALELSGGRRASLYLALAENVSVPAQDRTEFERLMRAALAVDLDAAPELRLANRLSQERARERLASIDEIFLPPLE
jgi:predicted anti-sigma-YlaC factor YlaD